MLFCTDECLRLRVLDATGTLNFNVILRNIKYVFSIRLKAHSYTFTILTMNLPSNAEIFRSLTLF